jgi:signal recognition particle GTPase
MRVTVTVIMSVVFVGVGEGIDDLEPFDPETFVDGLIE